VFYPEVLCADLAAKVQDKLVELFRHQHGERHHQGLDNRLIDPDRAPGEQGRPWLVARLTTPRY